MRLAALLLVALVACASAAPRVVHLIRHAEKPVDSSQFDLTAQGYARAACIAPFFTSAPFNITYVYAPNPTVDHGSRRALETATPTALKLGVTLDVSYSEGQEAQIAAALMAQSDAEILLAWEHKKLPDIMSALGTPNPPTYPSDHFDLIWTVQLDGTGAYVQTVQPAACTFPTPERVVHIIRPAEKPTEASDDLAPQGYERAACLASFFASSPFAITHVIAANPTPGNLSSRRSLETATPTALKLGVTLDLGYDESMTSDVASALLITPDTQTLLVWEHTGISDIIGALGNNNPPTYPSGEFDVVYTVQLDGTGSYKQFTQPAACTFPSAARAASSATAATAVAPPTQRASASRVVHIIRHGEKPADPNAVDLDPQGYERANCIAPFFASPPFNITYLYAANPTVDHPSKRSLETVTPFSIKSGLQIDLTYDETQTSDVAAALMARPDAEILLAWEHKRIPDIMSALGTPNPPTYPSDHFDLIWTVQLDGTGAYVQTTQPAACTFPSVTRTA